MTVVGAFTRTMIEKPRMLNGNALKSRLLIDWERLSHWILA